MLSCALTRRPITDRYSIRAVTSWHRSRLVTLNVSLPLYSRLFSTLTQNSALLHDHTLQSGRNNQAHPPTNHHFADESHCVVLVTVVVLSKDVLISSHFATRRGDARTRGWCHASMAMHGFTLALTSFRADVFNCTDVCSLQGKTNFGGNCEMFKLLLLRLASNAGMSTTQKNSDTCYRGLYRLTEKLKREEESPLFHCAHITLKTLSIYYYNGQCYYNLYHISIYFEHIL